MLEWVVETTKTKTDFSLACSYTIPPHRGDSQESNYRLKEIEVAVSKRGGRRLSSFNQEDLLSYFTASMPSPLKPK